MQEPGVELCKAQRTAAEVTRRWLECGRSYAQMPDSRVRLRTNLPLLRDLKRGGESEAMEGVIVH